METETSRLVHYVSPAISAWVTSGHPWRRVFVYIPSKEGRHWLMEISFEDAKTIASCNMLKIFFSLPRPFLSKLILLYPPPPMLSSSRSRHSIVVLNSYDDDPNMLNSRLTLESFFRSSTHFRTINSLTVWGSLHLTAFLTALGTGWGVGCPFVSFALLINGFSCLILRSLHTNWKLIFE